MKGIDQSFICLWAFWREACVFWRKECICCMCGFFSRCFVQEYIKTLVVVNTKRMKIHQRSLLLNTVLEIFLIFWLAMKV